MSYSNPKKVELDLGEIEICYAMIDVDGTNLEEGIDVFYEGKYAFCVINMGSDPEGLSEEDKEHLNNELYNFMFK
jgi:hypothetical protein